MLFTFSLPHVFHPGSDPAENARALQILMGCLISLDEAYLEDHPDTKPLYASGVRYGRTQTWDTIPEVRSKRYADCKSLTAWRIAELKKKNIPAIPVFRLKPEKRLYHILLRTSSGWEDPSKKCGMGQNENAYARY